MRSGAVAKPGQRRERNGRPGTESAGDWRAAKRGHRASEQDHPPRPPNLPPDPREAGGHWGQRGDRDRAGQRGGFHQAGPRRASETKRRGTGEGQSTTQRKKVLPRGVHRAFAPSSVNPERKRDAQREQAERRHREGSAAEGTMMRGRFEHAPEKRKGQGRQSCPGRERAVAPGRAALRYAPEPGARRHHHERNRRDQHQRRDGSAAAACDAHEARDRRRDRAKKPQRQRSVSGARLGSAQTGRSSRRTRLAACSETYPLSKNQRTLRASASRALRWVYPSSASAFWLVTHTLAPT